MAGDGVGRPKSAWLVPVVVAVVAAVAGTSAYVFVVGPLFAPGKPTCGVAGQAYASFEVERIPGERTFNVDASASVFPGQATPDNYTWDFGDNSGAIHGVKLSHTYASDGRYLITLTMAPGGKLLTCSMAKPVYATNQTLDFTLYDMFKMKYKEFWYERFGAYGDIILRNDEYPFTDYYPWSDDKTDFFIYSLYRVDVKGRNVENYTAADPIFLPQVGPKDIQATGKVDFDVKMDYFDAAYGQRLKAQGYDYSVGNNDGFADLMWLNMSMDYRSSQRYFGVEGNATAWWTMWVKKGPGIVTVTNPDGSKTLGVESKIRQWYEDLGNNRFDIFNGFEWNFQGFFLDVNDWKVTQNPDGTNTTKVTIMLAAWGLDVLYSRFFYYGSGCYPNGICDPGPDGKPYTADDVVKEPNGWWKQGLCWCEDVQFNGTLHADHMDFNYNAVDGYQLKAWAQPGPDGKLGTGDDVPTWNWEAFNMDYVQATKEHPKTELQGWVDHNTGQPYTYPHATPGSVYYGKQFKYDYPPVSWNLKAGETITFKLPRDEVVFYDPSGSHWDAGKRTSGYGLKEIRGKVALADISPGNVAVYSKTGKTVYFAGPVTLSKDRFPEHGFPWVEFSADRGQDPLQNSGALGDVSSVTLAGVDVSGTMMAVPRTRESV